jgi:hypothetical protein
VNVWRSRRIMFIESEALTVIDTMQLQGRHGAEGVFAEGKLALRAGDVPGAARLGLVALVSVYAYKVNWGNPVAVNGRDGPAVRVWHAVELSRA